jgi:hypothetical protein
MVKMPDCVISVEFALALRNLDRALIKNFRCPECDQPVEPHESGTGPDEVFHPAHFEHVAKNTKCSLSHRYQATSA